jgi:hypothetical protein
MTAGRIGRKVPGAPTGQTGPRGFSVSQIVMPPDKGARHRFEDVLLNERLPGSRSGASKAE